MNVSHITQAEKGIAVVKNFRGSPTWPVIEHCGTASRRTKLVAQVSRMTARPLLDLVATIVRPGILGVGGVVDRAAALIPVPRGTVRNPVPFDGYQAEWVAAERATPYTDKAGAILYFHGGGFVSCGYRTHRRLVATLSAATGMPVLNVAYRQLPRHSVGTSIADAVDAYRHLLAEGFPHERVVVAGDSAGGMLAFSVGVAVVRQDLPPPAGIVGLSPWLDLDCAAKFAHPNNRIDPYLSAHALDVVVRKGLTPLGDIDPLWSPVNCDLAGLPPALIQVGSIEMLLPDAEAMADRLAAAGVPVRLQIWADQPHVFHAAHDLLPEARLAIRDIASFVNEVTGYTRQSDNKEVS